MLRKSREDLDNPLALAMHEVGDAWMMMIVWAAVHGVTRFDEFQRELGVARNILAERLRRLVEFGLLEKTPINDGARRLEYRLTAKGAALEEPLRGLVSWSENWLDRGGSNRLQAAE